MRRMRNINLEIKIAGSSCRQEPAEKIFFTCNVRQPFGNSQFTGYYF